jgi:CheY-like chemotaxis protein
MAHPAERLCDPGSDTAGRLAGPRSGRLAGQKVLIVDDDPRGAFALGSALAAGGLTVVHAATGPDGLAAVAGDPTIRAVLMDIALPGLDGYATTARIRRLGPGRGPQPAIIAVTFEVSAADRARALAAGMDEHVPKPVDVARLLRLLEELMVR